MRVDKAIELTVDEAQAALLDNSGIAPAGKSTSQLGARMGGHTNDSLPAETGTGFPGE